MSPMSSISPGLILIVGAALVPFLRGVTRNLYMLLVPAVGLAYTLTIQPGSYGHIEYMGLTLEIVRVDRLANVFGIIFFIAALLSVLYSLKEQDSVQQVAALVYSGAAISAAYAGDLITMFVFWEITAVASVWLIWARRTERAYRAGMRYLVIQVGSGVLLLAGAILHFKETGSVTFTHLGLGSLGTVLIFFAFGIKCAFPLLHNWLQDAYPEATIGGTVWLSAFTTKLAVYALARGFAGTEILIWIGAAMTAFPIFFAVIENDLRRVLAYSLNNQLGFMVAGIGVGTELAIDGAVAHAFAHIIYKALLFMAMGAVLYRVGHVKASKLGGLYKSMPGTAVFCMVGSASISAFPLFSGFVSKSLILAATAHEGHTIAFLILLFASAGVLDHSGIKVPFFSFFFHDRGIRVKEAPWNMLAAMSIAALLCIAIGVWPRPLYAILPYPVVFAPYTLEHVVTQTQLLLFAMLAFVFLMRTGLYPPELPSVNIDFDIVYRKGLPAAVHSFVAVFRPVDLRLRGLTLSFIRRLTYQIYRHHGPAGALARSIGAGNMVLWVVVMLAAYLVITLVGF
jgi:multicomponent Na+:H+ antiporter subunit D